MPDTYHNNREPQPCAAQIFGGKEGSRSREILRRDDKPVSFISDVPAGSCARNVRIPLQTLRDCLEQRHMPAKCLSPDEGRFRGLTQAEHCRPVLVVTSRAVALIIRPC